MAWVRIDAHKFFRIIVSGRDPFVITTPDKDVLISPAVTAILFILLFFHTLVASFCLFVLIKSGISGAKHCRWFCKTLYIRDTSGKKVYPTPFYFFNAGILMTVTQLLNSACAQGYVWAHIKRQLSLEYAMHPVLLFLGPLNMFETLCHWSMSHCFLVTVYCSRGLHREMKMTRWISPPIFFNLLFISFPIGIVVTTVATYSWMALTHKRLVTQVWEVVEALSHVSSASGEKKARMKYQLVAPLIENWVHSVHYSLIMLLVLVWITSVVFILMFGLLIQRYLLVSRVDYLIHRMCLRSSRSVQAIGTNLSSTSNWRLTKQFWYLFLRALGILLSIITQLISLLVGTIKTHDILINNREQRVFTWLAITCGAWSAIPIALQCWRLYADQNDPGFPAASNADSPPMPSKLSRASSQSCEIEAELEVKLMATEVEVLSKDSIPIPQP